MFSVWWDNMRRRARRPGDRRSRPRLETLEERVAPAFTIGGVLPAASGPQALVAADWNADGNLDLAAAGSGNTISFFLGRGNGTFRARQDISVLGGPQGMAAGDINGDGKLDLAVAAATSGKLSVLLGNGDGTFQVPQSTAAGAYPVAVALGEFNGDGKLDAVVVDFDLNTAKVLLGKGDGTFQWSADLAVGGRPMSVAINDFNSDGKPDLAVASLDSSDVRVFRGQGDGTFQATQHFAAGSGPRSLVVGDFNGDRRPDLAVANSGSNDVSVLLGNGNGTFKPAKHFAAGDKPTAVTAGDINGDRKLDLAVTDRAGNTTFLQGNGLGSFTVAGVLASGDFPQSLAAGDFNGDGKFDVAAANSLSDNITFFVDAMPVTITDPDLADAIRLELGLPDDAVINTSDMLKLTKLAADSIQVTNLTGLEKALNLAALSLTPGNFSDLASRVGRLVSLAPLRQLRKLDSLALVGAGLTGVSAAQLPFAGNLHTLDLRYNRLTSVAFAPAVAGLRTLLVYGNPIAGYLPLKGKFIKTDLVPVGLDKAATVAEVAKALHYLPLDIYQYMLGNFLFQRYPGMMKGAQATLETKAGSTLELASLLIELFKASGVTARFADGTVEAGRDDVLNWLGMTHPDAAMSLLPGGAEQIKDGGGNVTGFRFGKYWVEALVPQALAQPKWVGFDPSWTFRDFQPGVPGILNLVPFDTAAENDYLAQARKETTLEWYENRVTQYLAANMPGVSLADIPYDGPIRPQVIDGVPESLPFTVVGTPVTFTQVTPNQIHRVNLTLKQGETALLKYSLSTPKVSLKRIVLSYSFSNAFNLIPELRIDDKVVARGTKRLSYGQNVDLVIDHLSPGGDLVDASNPASHWTGQYVAVGLNVLQFSERHLARLQAQYNKSVLAKINKQPFSMHDQIRDLLSLAVARWFYEETRYKQQIGRLTGAAHYTINAGSGVATAVHKVHFAGDLQNSVIPLRAGLDIGSASGTLVPIDNDAATRNPRFRLTDFNGSALEHLLWEHLINSRSVSTIKSLQLARERNIPIYTINQSNSWQINSLNHSQGIKDLIRKEVDAGNTVQIPRDPTALDKWNGVGWAVLRPDGRTAMKISGGTSGGASGDVIQPAPPVPRGNGQYMYSAGDPVNIANGNVTRDETDILLPGIGMPLMFARHFDSDNGVKGEEIGDGWSHTYSHFLWLRSDGTIKWFDDLGRNFLFTPIGGGNYSVPNTLHGAFTAVSGGYRFRNKDGMTYSFNSDGWLVEIKDRRGNGVAVNHLPNSWKITTVHDLADPQRKLTFTYAGDLIRSIRDFTGRTWTYSYSGTRLVRVTAPSDANTPRAVTRYAYYTDKALGGLLKQITQPNGGTISYTYYPNRRAFQVTDPLGFTQSFDYNLFRLRTSFIDERGFVTEHDYNLDGNLTQTIRADRSKEQFVWQDNLMRSSTDAYSKAETYQYDGMGNLTQVADRAGNITTFAYEPAFNQATQIHRPGGRTTRFTYDSAGNLTQIEDALGNRTTMTYDSRGQMLTQTRPKGAATPVAGDYTTTFTYNSAGQALTRSTDWPSTESMTYDSRGNLLTATDANGNTTTYEYDLLGRLVRTTDAAGGMSRIGYDVMGSPTTSTDALGRKTASVFDRKQRLTRMQLADGTILALSYDAMGNVSLQTDALGRATAFTYDSRNRRVRELAADGSAVLTDHNGGGQTAGVVDPLGNATRHSYDVLGRLTKTVDAQGGITTRTYDAVGNLIAVVDPLGRKSDFQYDLLNRQTKVIDPLGNTTTTAFDANGNVVSITDPLNHATQYQYDVRDRQTAIIDARGGVTSKNYDAAGNVSRIIDPRGNRITYAYDKLHRLLSENADGLPSRQYAYDSAGNRTSLTDRNGRSQRFKFDLQNRLSEEQWLDSNGDPIRTFAFTYDAAGQTTSVRESDSFYRFEYDTLGRPTQVDNNGTPGAPRVVLTYGYDAAGNVITNADQIDGQSAGVETFSYDALNRLTRVTQSGAGVAYKRVEFSHDAAGQPVSMSRFNAPGGSSVLDSQFGFDTAGRLTSLIHRLPAGSTLASYAWSYDAAGRITQASDGDGPTTYSYDDTNQLTAADHTGQADESYTYDAAGNRTNAGYSTGMHNRVSTDGVHQYLYDAEGNLTRRLKIATGAAEFFEWDHRNRLTRVISRDGGGNVVEEVEYVYDVFNRRIAKSVDADGPGSAAATVERFVYDGDHIALEFDGEGGLARRYLHGPRVDQVLADENSAGSVIWPLADNQGTVRDLVSNAGTLLNHLRYDSFGRVTSETNPAVDHRFGYTGRELDAETGLHYYRARYYDSATGRFISEDPAGFAAGDANLYRYVGNNSPNATDPTGLESWEAYFSSFFDLGTMSGQFIEADIMAAFFQKAIHTFFHPVEYVKGMFQSIWSLASDPVGTLQGVAKAAWDDPAKFIGESLFDAAFGKLLPGKFGRRQSFEPKWGMTPAQVEALAELSNEVNYRFGISGGKAETLAGVSHRIDDLRVRRDPLVSDWRRGIPLGKDIDLWFANGTPAAVRAAVRDRVAQIFGVSVDRLDAWGYSSRYVSEIELGRQAGAFVFDRGHIRRYLAPWQREYSVLPRQ